MATEVTDIVARFGVQGLDASVKAMSDFDKATAGVGGALENVTLDWGMVERAIRDYADEMQRVSDAPAKFAAAQERIAARSAELDRQIATDAEARAKRVAEATEQEAQRVQAAAEREALAIEQSHQRQSKSSQALSVVLQTTGRIANIIGEGIGEGFAVGGQKVIAFVRESTDYVQRYATSLRAAAQDARMSIEDISRAAEAATTANLDKGFKVSPEDMTRGLVALRSNLAQVATQSGPLRERMEAAGVSFERMGRDSLSASQMLGELANAYQRMGATERIDMVQRLGIQQLVPLLEGGEAAMNKYMASVNRLAVVSNEVAVAVERRAQAEGKLEGYFRNLQTAVGGVVNQLLAEGETWFSDSFDVHRIIEQATQEVAQYGEVLDATKDRFARVANGQRYLYDFIELGNAAQRSQLQTARQQLIVHAELERTTRMVANSFQEFGGWGEHLEQVIWRDAMAQSNLAVKFEQTRPPSYKDYAEGLDRAKTSAEEMAGILEAQAVAQQKLNEKLADEEKTRLRLAVLRGAGTPLPPKPPTPGEQFQQILDLQGGKTTAREMEAGLVSQVGRSAVDILGSYEKVLPIMEAYNAGQLNQIDAYKQIIALSPKVAAATAPYLDYISKAEKASGVEGNFTALKFKTVKQRVEGTKEAAVEYEKEVVRIENLDKRLAHNESSEAIWAAGQPRPADWTPAMGKAEHGALELERDNAKKNLPQLKKEMTGYWIDVLVPDVAAIDAALAKQEPQIDAIMRRAVKPITPPEDYIDRRPQKPQSGSVPALEDAIDRESHRNAGQWVQTGVDIMQGLRFGVESEKEGASMAILGVLGEIRQRVLSYLRIASPSGLFADDVGAPMMAGIAAGFSGNVSVLTIAVSTSMQEALTEAMSESYRLSWVSVGQYLMQAMADGIRANGNLVRAAMQDAVQGNANWLKQLVWQWVREMLRL